MIPNWDIMKYVDHNRSNFDVIIGTILNWLINAINRAVQSKKDMLYSRKPGSIVSSEPKIIWVKTLYRSEFAKATHARADQFNNLLNNLLLKKKFHHIMSINSALDMAEFYTSEDQLNDEGCVIFWKEMDKLLEKFDYKEISLKARDFNDTHRYRMPPPRPMVRLCSPTSHSVYHGCGDNHHVCHGEQNNFTSTVFKSHQHAYSK